MLREIFTPGHILIIAIVALVFFGPSKLPELGRGFGKMLREFKSGSKEGALEDHIMEEAKQEPPSEATHIPQFVEVKLSEAENKRRLP